jgi:hypothetical protein
MTDRKRKAELQAYHDLLSEFPEQQVAQCLEYLLKSGIPKTGEACHSPMAFLSKAMNLGNNIRSTTGTLALGISN